MGKKKGRLGPGSDAELVENDDQMVADGLFGEIEFAPDLLVREAAGDQTEEPDLGGG